MDIMNENNNSVDYKKKSNKDKANKLTLKSNDSVEGKKILMNTDRELPRKNNNNYNIDVKINVDKLKSIPSTKVLQNKLKLKTYMALVSQHRNDILVSDPSTKRSAYLKVQDLRQTRHSKEDAQSNSVYSNDSPEQKINLKKIKDINYKNQNNNNENKNGIETITPKKQMIKNLMTIVDLKNNLLTEKNIKTAREKHNSNSKLQLIDLTENEKLKKSKDKNMISSKFVNTNTNVDLSKEINSWLKKPIHKKALKRFKIVSNLVFFCAIMNKLNRLKFENFRKFSLNKFVYYYDLEQISIKIKDWIYNSIKVPYLSILKMDNYCFDISNSDKVEKVSTEEGEKYLKLEVRIFIYIIYII